MREATVLVAGHYGDPVHPPPVPLGIPLVALLFVFDIKARQWAYNERELEEEQKGHFWHIYVIISPRLRKTIL